MKFFKYIILCYFVKRATGAELKLIANIANFKQNLITISEATSTVRHYFCVGNDYNIYKFHNPYVAQNGTSRTDCYNP